MNSVPEELQELYQLVGAEPFTARSLPHKFRLRWLHSNGYLKCPKTTSKKRTPRTYIIADLYITRIQAQTIINDPETLTLLKTGQISMRKLSVLTGLTRSTLAEKLREIQTDAEKAT